MSILVPMWAKNTTSWKFTRFYSHPDVGKRKESWNLLCYLRSFQPEGWLCMGDFNETLDDSEKNWGSPKATESNEGLPTLFRMK